MQGFYVYDMRGICYFALGKHGRALKEFKKAIGENQYVPKVHYNLGVIYCTKRAYKDAAQEFSQTLALEQGHIKAKKMLMRLKAGMKDFPLSPRISIIMPTYNRSQMVCQAIKSVLMQTFKNFELIIIDDGSTDDTKRLIASIADKRII